VILGFERGPDPMNFCLTDNPSGAPLAGYAAHDTYEGWVGHETYEVWIGLEVIDY